MVYLLGSSLAENLKFQEKFKGKFHRDFIFLWKAKDIDKIRNLESVSLIIEEISTSCTCITAKLSPMLIPPGSQANLHVEYNSNAHESDRGKLERYVFISSNDPQKGNLQIKFSVFVKVK